MQENRFEKKVQQQMEELRFRPSAAVWERVEDELSRRRRRRRLIYVSIAATLLVASLGGYRLYTHENDRSNRINPVSIQKNTTAPAEMAAEKHRQSVPAENTAPDVNSNAATVKQDAADLSKTTSQDKTGKHEQMKPAPATDRPAVMADRRSAVKENDVAGTGFTQKQNKPAPDKKNATMAKAGNREQVNEKAKLTAEKINGAQKEEKEEKGWQASRENKEPVAKPVTGNELATAQQEENRNDSTQHIAIAATDGQPGQKEADLSAADTAAVAAVEEAPGLSQPAAYKIKKRIRIGFEVSGGISQVQNNPLGLGGTKDAYQDAYTPGFSSSAFTYPASPVRPGVAFNAGVTLALPVSKRSTVPSGLYYQYRSTNTSVGYFLDMAATVNNGSFSNNVVNGYYRARQQSPYTNRYHFAEIPLTYQWQINKGKKWPLTWDAGLSANYLLATNAVRYDTTQGGIYYKEKEGFNRLNIAANTGLMLNLKRNGKIKWSAGPALSFQLRELSNDKLYRKEYLFYAGLRMRMFL
ncbi:MAG TPA: outer membrane beta-barrel protein [Chitinophagaceae bacterium]|nr:outer membrane beta-barrel protein [Chitinophagaceae bacterium]